MNCDQVRLSLGVYVLGAIDPSERPTVERHLEWCQDCRAELGQLAEIPPLLDQLRPVDLEQLEESKINQDRPKQDVLDGLLARAIAIRRRRQRWMVLAAVLVIILGGLSVLLTQSPLLPSQQTETWAAADTATGMKGQARLASTTWGTSISLEASGIPAGTDCTVVVNSRDGTNTPAGTWRADYSGAADVPLATSTPLAEIESLVITNDQGVTLLHLRR